ncbi:carbon starvation protein A [Escherichia coli]|uniref:Carbon starvation protein A n=1 Tax=Escherichia coli TaxID=562 RepID=A0A377E829_ECOLX|nr:carbon starvation protein A [Escherichia coli]
MDTHTDNNYEQIREIPRLDSALCNGSICSGYIALNRGEQINALWIVGGVGLYLSDRLPFLWVYIAKNVLAVDRRV